MNEIKDISQHLESNFFDEGDKNEVELLTSKKNFGGEKKEIKDDYNFLNILNDVPGNDSDLDANKQLSDLVTFLKKEIKNKDKIIKELLVQIKELFKDLKKSTKNDKIVSEILKILGYSLDIIKIINFDFNLELKK
jgi:hypothetical protein